MQAWSKYDPQNRWMCHHQLTLTADSGHNFSNFSPGCLCILVCDCWLDCVEVETYKFQNSKYFSEGVMVCHLPKPHTPVSSCVARQSVSSGPQLSKTLSRGALYGRESTTITNVSCLMLQYNIILLLLFSPWILLPRILVKKWMDIFWWWWYVRLCDHEKKTCFALSLDNRAIRYSSQFIKQGTITTHKNPAMRWI